MWIRWSNWNGTIKYMGTKRKVRKNMQGSTAKTKGHLNVSYGNLMQEKLPKMYAYMKKIYIKLWNDARDRAPTGHCLPPNKVSSSRNGLHLIKLLAKEVPWEPLNNLGYIVVLLIAFLKPMLRFCWRHHLYNSLLMEVENSDTSFVVTLFCLYL